MMQRLGNNEATTVGSEEGMTLIEILLAVSLMLVVLTVATAGLLNLSKSSTAAQQRTFSMQQNRVGLERLSYLLRQATYAQGVSADTRNAYPVITTAGSNQVIFTSRGAGTSAVQQFTAALSGSNLQIGRSESCSGSPCTTWTTPTMSTLIDGVQNTPSGACAAKINGSNATFRYYQSDSHAGTLNEIPIPPSSDPLTQANDAAVLATIDTVQISLWTQESRAGVTKTCEPLQARVNLRNMTVQ